MTIIQGKVALVTGANSGIGRATALGLAKLGATVVMVCHSQERGEAARAEIIAKSGNDAVDLLIADLSSQQSIRQLAANHRYTVVETLDKFFHTGQLAGMKRLCVSDSPQRKDY